MKKTSTQNVNGFSMRKMFRSSIIMMLLILSINGFGQQSLGWGVTPNQVNFTSLSPVVSILPHILGSLPDYDGLTQAQNAQNAMYDANGNLLFFIIDGAVYDKLGYFIGDVTAQMRTAPPITNYDYTVQGISEYLIIPVPGSCTQYYLVAATYINSGTGQPEPFAYYITLDLSLPNTNMSQGSIGNNNNPPGNPLAQGDFTTQYAIEMDPIVSSAVHYGTAQFAISQLRAGSNDRLLVMNDSYNMYYFNVTSLGISTSGAYITNLLYGNGAGLSRNEMEMISLTNGNYRIATGYDAGINAPTNTSKYKIQITEIDPTGTFVSSKNIDLPYIDPINQCVPKGLEFSPDGTYLYVSHTNLSHPYIEYSDVTVALPTVTSLSIVNNGASAQYQFGQIELGHDGKMYFGSYTSGLGVLNDPLNPTTSTWANNAVNVSTPLTTLYGIGNTELCLLNDQIDGEDYVASAFRGTLACCLQNNSADGEYYGIKNHSIIENYIAGTIGLPHSGTATGAASQVWTPTSNPFGGNIGNPITTVIVKGYLTIPAGFDITIQGMTFLFKIRYDNCSTPGIPPSYGAKVSVLCGTPAAHGGYLRLNSTTFSSYEECKITGLWEGVEVYGSSQYPTFISKQGRIFINNNSTISNAIIGITAGKKNTNYDPDFTTTAPNNGGIITCGSYTNPANLNHFFNNSTDVVFPTLVNPYQLCSFSYTDFRITEQLHDNCYLPMARANFCDNSGVSFYACTFSNDNTSPYPTIVGTWNLGIYGNKAGFNCKNGFDGTPCIFYGVGYGIQVLNSGTTRTINCQDARFNFNWRGIYINTVNYASLVRNNFTLISYAAPNEQMATYGIYVDYSHGFCVESNYFTAGAGNQSNINYGIIANETNPKRTCGQADLIDINTFEYVNIGIQTQGNNSEQDAPCAPYYGNVRNDVGLVLKCNTFVQGTIGKFDINVANCIPPFGFLTYGNIAYLQGSTTDITSPASNRFSHTFCAAYTAPPTMNDYIVTATYDVTNTNPYLRNNPTIDYFDFVDIDPYCYTPNDPGNYLYGLSITNFNNTTLFDASASCKAIAGRSPIEIKNDITNYGTKTDSLSAILYNGDRQGLVDTINNGTESTIVSALTAASPYLSDRVLLAAINKGLQASNIESILVSNSPLTDSIKIAADSANLPASVHSAIDAAQNGNTSARKSVQINTSYSFGQKQLNLDALIRYNLQSTNQIMAFDSVLDVLNDTTISTIKASSDSSKLYFTKGDLTTATTISNTIRATGQNDKFSDYMDVQIAVKQAGGNDSVILSDATLLAKMQGVADDKTATESAGADALLKKLNGMQYNEWIEPTSTPEQRRAQTNNQHKEPIVANTHKLALYPVPATDEVTIEVNLPDGMKEGTIEIIDVTGRRLEKIAITGNTKLTVNTTLYAKGVYMCTLKGNEKSALIDKVKMVIIK